MPWLRGALALVSSTQHLCALLPRDGAVVLTCWGSNRSGQIAAELPADVPDPATVAAPSDVSAIALGPSHTCVLGSTGTVTCWGRDADGQLGDGAVPYSAVPLVVPSPAARD